MSGYGGDAWSHQMCLQWIDQAKDVCARSQTHLEVYDDETNHDGRGELTSVAVHEDLHAADFVW